MAGRFPPRLLRVVLALSIGFLFLLPHLIRIQRLGSYAAYTPFSALSASPMVWDETFLYGAEVNYTLVHRAPAYDTDTWEHRGQPYPYSILPITLEASLAGLLGSVKTAHLLCALLFPALTAFLLATLFSRLGARATLAALFALAVLVLGFSPTTLLLNNRALLHHLQGAPLLESLQAARTPNPNLTFPLFLAALFSLTHALGLAAGRPRAALLWSVAAGVLGGLLFFSYIFYAIAWSAAVALLVFTALLPRSALPRNLLSACFAATLLLAAPFLWWRHASVQVGAYLPRSLRTGLESGHALHPRALALTAAYLLLALLSLAAWRWIDTRRHPPQAKHRAFATSLFPVLLAALPGALAGLNMQLLTGFNLQAEHHFPHMVLQPVALVLLAALAVLALPRFPPTWSTAAFVLFFAACAAAQYADGAATAQDHRLPYPDEALFAFLNEHTPAGSVLATDDLRLSIEVPTLTHNRTLFANGTRSTATDAELLDRFLLASRLAGASAETVRAELSRQQPLPRPAPQVPTYTYYLFETSPFESPGARAIDPAHLPAILDRYRTLDVSGELLHYRVDLLWIPNPNPPSALPGWSFTPLLTLPEGRLWSVARA